MDSSDLLELIKQASIDALRTTQPSDFVYGVVVSDSPLKIQVEQKITLTTAQLVLTRNVTDYETNVTVDWFTEDEEQEHHHGGSVEQDVAHSHEIVGKKKMTIHNKLKNGEKVVLIKANGGQKFWY